MSSRKSSHPDKANCSYCFRDISYRKLLLHERLCQSLSIRCDLCSEVVPIEELEEHMKEAHPSKGLQGGRLTSRKKSVKKSKEEPCRYCDLMFFDNDEALNEHEYFCGSKSEECSLCGLLIPKKYYNEHLTTQCLNNSAIKRPKKTKQNCNGLRSSTRSKNFSSIRRKLLSLDKEIERKCGNSKTLSLDPPSKTIKRNLFFSTTVHPQAKPKHKKSLKEEANYTIDHFLSKKHPRS